MTVAAQAAWRLGRNGGAAAGEADEGAAAEEASQRQHTAAAAAEEAEEGAATREAAAVAQHVWDWYLAWPQRSGRSGAYDYESAPNAWPSWETVSATAPDAPEGEEEEEGEAEDTPGPWRVTANSSYLDHNRLHAQLDAVMVQLDRIEGEGRTALDAVEDVTDEIANAGDDFYESRHHGHAP